MRKKSNSTIKDVARLADASIATVSRVLNNTDYPVSEMTRKRILEAAKELKIYAQRTEQSPEKRPQP